MSGAGVKPDDSSTRAREKTRRGIKMKNRRRRAENDSVFAARL